MVGTVLLAALAIALPAAAAPLETVVRAAIDDFPTIRAAQANREIGRFRIEEARARHLPTVDIGAAARVAGETASTPLPRARLNLWSFGAIEAAIERESQATAALEDRTVVSREDVAFAATQAYLRTLRAAWLVRVAEANVERHQRLAEDFRQIASIDVGRRFDLVQALARTQLVRGQLEDRIAELEVARQSLARFYREPLAVPALGLPAIAALPEAPPSPLDDHPTIAAARRDVLAAEANARALRLQRGPRLDLEAFGGRDPLSRVVLSWPAFDPGLTAAERGAAAAQAGAEASLQDVSLQVLEARRQAAADATAAARRIAQAGRQIELATELVTVYFEQFRVGRRNLLDLLNAYAELSTGESALAASRVDQVLARYRVAYADGRIVPLFESSAEPLPLAPPPEPARVPPLAASPARPPPPAR
ncbi:MAG TPA: TolC family protein [Burkholderiaceae bacterium]|nr:TolC family protein [Burkholderiaceae bacterium]